MRTVDQSGVGTTRLDRRDVLRRSAAALAMPAALAAAGVPAGEAAARAAGGNGRESGNPGQRHQAMNDGGFSPTRLEQMHEAMAAHVGRGRLPGLVTLLSRRGEVAVDAIGETAFDSGDPMRRDTIFRIASVTKPITAAAAMILVEECKLRLDEPVDDLLPELANRQVLRAIDGELDDTAPANRPITLRDLLTFRSGYGAMLHAARPVAAPARR